MGGWYSLNRLSFVRKKIIRLPGLDESKPEQKTAIKFFLWRARYSVKLLWLEKEIITFALLQWASIAIGYILWIQMLNWIPEEIWLRDRDSENFSVIDIALFAWSFVCIGVAAFPLGLFSGCMGAAHFLHHQGRSSTVAACLRIVASKAWSL